MTACPLLLECRASQFLADAGVASFADVPVAFLQSFRDRHYDSIYLLGVWQTGPAGLQHSVDKLRNEGQADLVPQAVSSCFAIQTWRVHDSFGGNAALLKLRVKMNSIGLRLIIDLVANHVAVDHEWVMQRPELFVLGTEDDWRKYGASRYFPLQIPLREESVKTAPSPATAPPPLAPAALAPPIAAPAASPQVSEASAASSTATTAGGSVAPNSVAGDTKGTTSVGAPDSVRAGGTSSTAHSSEASMSSLPSSASATPPVGISIAGSPPMVDEPQSQVATIYVAHGREFFARDGGWRDTAQLDYRNPLLKSLMAVLLCRLCVSGLCNGVRCDLAMLQLDDVFRRTWGDNRVEVPPQVAEVLRQRRRRREAEEKKTKKSAGNDNSVSRLLSFSSALSSSSSSSSSSGSSSTSSPAQLSASPVLMTSIAAQASGGGGGASGVVVVPSATIALPPAAGAELQPPQPPPSSSATASGSTTTANSGPGALPAGNGEPSALHLPPAQPLGPGLGLGAVGVATRPVCAQSVGSLGSSSKAGSSSAISITIEIPPFFGGGQVNSSKKAINTDLTLELGEISNFLSPRTVISAKPLVELAAAAADPSKMSDEAAAAITGMLANQVKAGGMAADGSAGGLPMQGPGGVGGGEGVTAKVVQDGDGKLRALVWSAVAAPPAPMAAASTSSHASINLASASSVSSNTSSAGSSTTVTITMDERGEFWLEAIAAVKKISPQFLLLAEAYWGTEDRLLELGHDFAYDKLLYDAAVADGSAEAILARLRSMPLSRQLRCARFVENHDEKRAAVAHRGGWLGSLAAAVVTLTTPCLRLLHDGQEQGLLKQHSVHVGLRPAEGTPNLAQSHPELPLFYSRLLQFLSLPSLYSREDRQPPQWHIASVTPSKDGNPSHRNLIAFFLSAPPPLTIPVGGNSSEVGGSTLRPSFLVAVNHSGGPSDGHISFNLPPPPPPPLASCAMPAIEELLGQVEKVPSAPHLVFVDRMTFPLTDAAKGTSSAAEAATDALATATAQGASTATTGGNNSNNNTNNSPAAITCYGNLKPGYVSETALAYPVKLLRSEGMWLRLEPWGVRIYEISRPSTVNQL